MKTTSIQLPDAVRNDLKELAKKTGKSQSDLMRDFIEVGINRQSLDLSLADRWSDVKGCFSGPRDLSRRKAFEG